VGRVLASLSSGFGLLSPLVARFERELTFWLWRRARARQGSPVTLIRRHSGRGYELPTRRRHANPT